MKCRYLSELSEIVKSARRSLAVNKLRFFGDIYSAVHLIHYMDGKNIDTGILLETFTELQYLFGKQEGATELLKKSYKEIARLLGKGSCHTKEFQEKLIA